MQPFVVLQGCRAAELRGYFWLPKVLLAVYSIWGWQGTMKCSRLCFTWCGSCVAATMLQTRIAACRWHSDQVLINVWCPQQHVLALPAFDPTVLDSWHVMQYERLLLLPEQQFLQLMSTSPDHEPAWFVQGAGMK